MHILSRCVHRVLVRTVWASKSTLIRSRGIQLTSAAPTVIRSRYEDLNLPEDTTVVDFVFEKIDRYGDFEALVDGASGRSYKFNQVKPLTQKVASALSRQGYKKDDVFCMMSPNLPEYPLMSFGVARMGGVIAAVNPTYTEDELVRQISLVEAKMLITIPPLAETALNVKKRLPHVQDVVVFGESQGCRPFESLLEDDGSALPSVKTAPSDLFSLLFSSGTTGLPKAVMVTNSLTAWNLAQSEYKDILDTQQGESGTAVLPYFHVYGQLIMMHCLRAGVRQVSLPRFDQEQFLKMIQDYKINHLFVAPPIILFLAKHPMVDNYDVSSVRRIISGAAPLGGEVSEGAKKRLSMQSIRQGYGLTESGPTTHIEPLDLTVSLPSSIGKLVSNTEAKIIDTETGKALGPREVGELCIRGPQITPGYYKNPEATAETIDSEGFLHTGDVGFFDEDEMFYIVDRLKELIKYKGFQVAPAELEALLDTHPSISDAAVIGIQDDEAGEIPRAYVVRTNESLTEEEVKEFVAGKVAGFKKLRGGVEFVEEIPKTLSGKILRTELREKFNSEQ